MKGILRYSFPLLALCWLVTACNDHAVYHSFQSISSKGWGKSDTLFFRVPLSDSLPPLQLFAEVRNLNNFRYRELYLFVSHNFEDSMVWKTDTLRIILTDKEGRWLGTGAGNLYQSALPMGYIRTNIKTNHPDTCILKVVHGMKDERLIGIQDIGFRIEKTN